MLQKNNEQRKELNLWAIYGICLFISAIFFLLFGFNSPLYTYNSDHDYQWFMTMGNGLVHGKIPYRDLFEQKGPIVYFVTAFCCLFQNPSIVMLIIEIFSMSLFFFFAYRICNKRLNTFYSLLAIPLLAFAIFTSWSHLRSASTMEEFCLPIYTYFLLVWLEFLEEKKHWTQLRAFCLGLCFGILVWIKFTLLYFVLVPLIIWFFISLRRRQYRILFLNLLFICLGALTITTPILIFYGINNALDDLFYVYFYINLTAYARTTPEILLINLGNSINLGPVFIFLILYGVIRFSIQHWRNFTGRFVLIAFFINLLLIIYSANKIAYYYNGLVPYSILGVIYILEWLSKILTKTKLQKYWISIIIFSLSIILCIPFSILTYEWGRNKNEYAPLVVADIIQKYEESNNTEATIYCYRLHDFGFYNAANKIPNNYYFANNVFDKKRFPEFYKALENYIINQTTDFVITKVNTWEKENNLLSQYYKPYTENLDDCIFHYRKVNYFYYLDFDLILLIKK